jgi:hypothetical protein
MGLTNRKRRWAVSVAMMVCLVVPLLVACGGKAPEPSKESPDMAQQRKQKKDN